MRVKAGPIVAALLAAAAPARAQQPPAGEGPAKNLQVLPKDMTRAQLMVAMRRFASALGVTCDYCHVRTAEGVDNAADTKPTKLKAREMIRMTGRINRELLPAAVGDLGSGLNVQCITCHRGAPRPVMLEDSLRTIIITYNADSAVAAYQRLKVEHAGRMRYDFGERTLTDLGTRLAAENRLTDARRILELNAEQFPQSWNVAYELGVVYERLNERELAIAQYRKALSIQPNAAQAQRRLDALGGGGSAERPEFTYDQGGITRGPRDQKRLALVFTGGSFAEGADAILDALGERGVKASFFVTGDFIRTAAFQPILHRIVKEGHYLGPHSDAHLLYAPWEKRDSTIVTQAQFRADLEKNLADLEKYGRTRAQMRWFIPPYEWYNRQIVDWTRAMGLELFNYTPGTRSNADYMLDSDPRFISSQRIYQSILDREAAENGGLNGFLLLLHVGAGPERTDKMHPYVGRLVDELRGRGYQFATVEELLR